ncbi:hypothetical protein RFI_38965, partial [Reticulomyxa filosa]
FDHSFLFASCLEERERYAFFLKKKRGNEMHLIVEYWLRLADICFMWIDDLEMIVLRYALVNDKKKDKYPKYFKASKVLQGHLDFVNCVKFSPDGSNIVSASNDTTIRVWDVKTGNQLGILQGHTDIVNDAQFSLNGEMIVSCSNDTTIRLWDAKSYLEIRKLIGHFNGVTRVQFSSISKMIVSGSYDQTIRLWD